MQRRFRAVAAIKGTSIRQYCLTAISKAVYQEFYPATSKAIIHEIDRVLARHYSFTEEELDFIINYDTKYRMGRIE